MKIVALIIIMITMGFTFKGNEKPAKRKAIAITVNDMSKFNAIQKDVEKYIGEKYKKAVFIYTVDLNE